MDREGPQVERRLRTSSGVILEVLMGISGFILEHQVSLKDFKLGNKMIKLTFLKGGKYYNFYEQRLEEGKTSHR